jgi:hypothetical protein
MSSVTVRVPDVFTAREIANAAGVRPNAVRSMIEDGSVSTLDGRFVAVADAVRPCAFCAGWQSLTRNARFSARASGQAVAGQARRLGRRSRGAVALLVLLTVGMAAPTASRRPRCAWCFWRRPVRGWRWRWRAETALPPPKAEAKGTAVERSVPRPRPITTRPPEPQPSRRSLARRRAPG